MDLKDELRKRGLTEQQINSKAVETTEAVLAEKQGVEIDTLRKLVKSLELQVRMESNLSNDREYRLKKMMNDIDQVENKVSRYVENVEKTIVNDPKLCDALNFYSALLTRTQEVFGAENMTEAVIVKTLETASYSVWRGIMGAKYNESEPFEGVKTIGRR